MDDIDNAWVMAFNPNIRGSVWTPINASPDRNSGLEFRRNQILASLRDLSASEIHKNFDIVYIFLPLRSILDSKDLLDVFPNQEVVLLCSDTSGIDTNSARDLEVSFEDWSISNNLISFIDKGKSALFIAPFTFNSTLDVRPMLRAIKKVLKLNPSNKLMALNLTTKVFYPQWQCLNFDNGDFISAMENSGFQHLPGLGSTFHQIDSFTTKVSNFFECSPDGNSRFLQNIGACQNITVLNVTSESTKFSRTGGIGKYIEEFEKSDVDSYFLMAGMSHSEEVNINLLPRWSTVERFTSTSMTGEIDYEGTLSACLQILFIMDEITVVEYQDYLGIGFRIAQAKVSGLLPEEIRVNCVAHGNQFYLQSGFDEFGKTQSTSVIVKERIAAELSDSTVFATNFLHKMYLSELNYEFKSTQIRPYPNSFLQDEDRNTCGEISRLVFAGKPTKFKGFEYFKEALDKLNDDGDLDALNIQDLFILGAEQTPQEVAALPIPNIISIYPSSAELTKLIKEMAPNSLFVLPYTSDNSPLLVQEMISSAHHYLLSNSGGIPEIVPPHIADQKLFDLDVNVLASRIKAEVLASKQALTSTHDYKMAESLDFFQTKNAEFNQYFRNIEHSDERDLSKVLDPSFTVIVTMFNPQNYEVRDCIDGINNQTAPPVEVIFVDDESEPSNYLETKQIIETSLMTKFRIVRLESNQGLSAARNIGLSQTHTSHVITLDIDDVIHPNYLYKLSKAFKLTGADIVTSGSKYFYEDCDFREIYRNENGGYIPTGNSFALGLTENTFGHACAGYLVSYIKSLGGWDDSNRAMWEDWQMFLKSSIAGAKIVLLPEEMLFYRIRKDSMLRTYKKFPAWSRLSSELTFLPANFRFEFLSSFASSSRLANSAVALQAELDSHVLQVNELRSQLLNLGDQHGELRLELLNLGDKYYALKTPFYSRVLRKLVRKSQ